MTSKAGKIKSLILLLLLVLNCVSASAQINTEALDKLLKSPSISSDYIGILVTDLNTEEVLVGHNETKPFIPASIMKAVTSASLSRVASPDKILRTKVYYTGKITDGVLDGNIVVEGSGDPTVNAGSGPASNDIVAEIADALLDKGIKTVKGRIIVEKSIFREPATPPSWQKGDLSTYYGTGCHGFNFESNATGKQSVANPSAVFIGKLKTKLANAGVSVNEETIAESGKRKMLVEHVSAPLEDIMRSCMQRSDNLYAEALLRLFALERDLPGATDEGAREEMDYWKQRRANLDGVTIVDGSGLSRSNRLTPQFLTDVLTLMKTDEVYASYFPLVGEEGTVRNFMKETPLAGYMALKTGSMNGVQCYAGYKLDEDYAPTHTIVIIANELKNRDAFRKALADFFLTIFSE